jgi:hypothetical protein
MKRALNLKPDVTEFDFSFGAQTGIAIINQKRDAFVISRDISIGSKNDRETAV